MVALETIDNAICPAELVRKLKDGLGERATVFENVRCPDPFNAKESHRFPVVVLTEHGVLPFVAVNQSALKASELLATVDYKLRVLADSLRVSLHPDAAYVLLSVAESTALRNPASFERYRVYRYFSRALGNEQLQELSLRESLKDVRAGGFLASAGDRLDDNDVRKLSRALSALSVGSNGAYDPSKVMVEEDAAKVFRMGLFGGIFGAHRFYLKMYGTGIVYLLTLGLLGVGWFFDCLEILLGVWKKNGRKLKPLPNRKKHAVEFAVVFAFFVVVLLLLHYCQKNILLW